MKLKSPILFSVFGGILIGFTLYFWDQYANPNLIDRAAAFPTTQFNDLPQYIGSKKVAEDDTTIQPFALALHEGKLLVAYLGSDRVDEFSPTLHFIRTLRLLNGEDGSITGVTVEQDRLYAANFRNGEILVVDYATGTLVNSYGFFPDQKTTMKVFGIITKDEIIYATDSRTNQILAISANEIPNLRDEGELLLSFPSPNAQEYPKDASLRDRRSHQLSFPTFTAITPDGRLLVSDVGNKEVKAFTCSGKPAHRFETEGEAAFLAPMGIAFDDLPSPELLSLKDTIFNPSGVFQQGRIHVVDAKLGKIKVFNSLGKYILSYGIELRQPNGIAIDQSRRIIFVADTGSRVVHLYKY